MASSLLDDFASSFYDYVDSAMEASLEMEQEVMDFYDISESLEEILEDYEDEVYFYGSRVIGIANNQSDLDIFVDVTRGSGVATRDAYFSGRTRRDQIRILEALKAGFYNHPDWTVEKAGILYNAAVPILFAHYTGYGRNLHCEIAVKDGMSTETSLLLNHLFDIQPEAKKLFHFVRIWLKRAGIKLKGYQITLLVLFHLQQDNFMPSIERVQRNVPLKEVCGWPVEFNSWNKLCNYGCKKLRDHTGMISGFFNFYASFNYNEFVIFPNFGCAVEKNNFPDQDCLQHFSDDIRHFRWDNAMAMAGPFSIANNVALNVKGGKLNTFIKICRSAEEILDYYQIC